jgi:hypothetical protein
MGLLRRDVVEGADHAGPNDAGSPWFDLEPAADRGLLEEDPRSRGLPWPAAPVDGGKP